MLTSQLRILLIVPDLGLELSPEIDTFYPYGYNVLPIQGDVTRERIMQNIQKHEFDIIHYAGHSGAQGVRLSDGKDGHPVILDAPTLVQLARAVKAKLVFINGCQSIEVGQFLIDEHIPYVICTMADIDNVMARETAQLFYASLAETNDIRTAFDLSKPPVKGRYVILNNGIKELSLKPILDRLDQLGAFVTHNDAEHAKIEQSIAANREQSQRQLEGLTLLFKKSRLWQVGIMVGGMVGVGVIVGLMGMLGRGALP